MKKRTKFTLLLATFFSVIGITVGLIGLCMMNGDWGQLARERSITNTYDLTESFDRIVIEVDTTDVIVCPSINGTSHVTTLDTEKYHHEVSVENGTLTIRLKDTRKWYERIGFYTSDTKVTLHLADSVYALLSVKGTTCDISVNEGLSFHEADIKTTTGTVGFDALVKNALSINTDTGDVEVKGSALGSLRVQTGTGKVVLQPSTGIGTLSVETDTADVVIRNASCTSLSVKCDTGDVKLEGVTAANMNVETNTGDVDFVGCDANEITVHTDTGDVEGSLRTGKAFEVRTDTGKVRVPTADPSGGICRITTDTGDVHITIGS
jgi:DUF4097 and DUF4098 domain-containing protein YvlB